MVYAGPSAFRMLRQETSRMEVSRTVLRPCLKLDDDDDDDDDGDSGNDDN